MAGCCIAAVADLCRGTPQYHDSSADLFVLCGVCICTNVGHGLRAHMLCVELDHPSHWEQAVCPDA